MGRFTVIFILYKPQFAIVGPINDTDPSRTAPGLDVKPNYMIWPIMKTNKAARTKSQLSGYGSKNRKRRQ